MDKKDNKKDFDLSVLTYKELIDLNYKVEEFLSFLDEKIKNLDIKEGNDE